MPTETAIVIAGITLLFAVFAVTLAWADFYTRNIRASRAEQQFSASSNPPWRYRGARTGHVMSAPAPNRRART